MANLDFEPELKDFSGYLSKLKRTPTSFSTSWNKRFFRINAQEKTLEYYNKEPKDGQTNPSDKRIIDLGNVVEVRVVDPWTFQLEVQENSVESPRKVDGETRERVKSLQLQSGGMQYFCLQAKSPGEQMEWRSILENYVSDLAKFRGIKQLEARALDARRSVTTNAMEMELERVMDLTTSAI